MSDEWQPDPKNFVVTDTGMLDDLLRIKAEAQAEERIRVTQTVGTIEIADGDGIVRFGYQGSPPVFLVAFGTKAEALAARDARGMLELLRRIEYIDDGRCPACGGSPPAGDGPMYARHADEVAGGKLIPCRLGASLDKHGRD